MPQIDRDVFRALAEHTAAGRRIMAELKGEVYRSGAAFAAPGTSGGASRASSDRFFDAVAEALFTGRPNLASMTSNGRSLKDDMKAALLSIVRGG